VRQLDKRTGLPNGFVRCLHGGFQISSPARANKLARTAWLVIARNTVFDVGLTETAV